MKKTIGIAVAALCAAACAAAPKFDADGRFAAECDAGWRTMMATRWLESTGLVYGLPPDEVRSSKGAKNGMFRWKDGVGYGRGIGDCALNCGTALSGLVDRDAVLKDGSTHETAAKVARGLLNLAKLHGVRGFVARGVCADDGRTICSLSSRDQITHWLHGLWRYSRSPMADPALVEEFKSLAADVACRMETVATEENGWNFLQADGSPDPRGICTMWGPDLVPHERARLPMVYAVAFLATGDSHWRDLYERCIDEALDKTLLINGEGRAEFLKKMPCYAMYQANCGFEPILALERDPVRRAKAWTAMGAFAEIAAKRAEVCLGKPEAKHYGMCWDGELALTILMAPKRCRPAWFDRFLAESVERGNLSTGTTFRASHLLAAYWRRRAER